jgi:Domain of unknown function (DUF4114)/Bacterial Ig-like domain/PAP2 superfamily
MDILDTQQNPQLLFSSDIFSGLTDKYSIDTAQGDRGLAQLPSGIEPIITNNFAANPIDLPATDIDPQTYLADDLARQSGYNFRSNPATTETLQTIDRALVFSLPNREPGDLLDRINDTVADKLQSFFSQANYQAELGIAFGKALDRSIATNLADLFQSQDLSPIPSIQVLTDKQLNGTLGAFDAANQKIYLSQALLATGDVAKIVPVLIEEIGHYLDTQLNQQDSLGDEGEIFARLVDKEPMSATQLVGLQLQNDTSVLNIDGQQVTVEEADGDPGVYTVDDSGKIAIDFLSDGGAYRNQMGLFSLTGMENLAAGSEAFIKEAARRALSGTDGYIAVDRDTDAGKFQLEAGHDTGKYSGRKTFSFKPGDRIVMMIVPDGSIQEVFNAPTIDGSKRPLFSIAAANPGAFQQIGELADGVYGWEDIRRDKTSDADYNDLLFQVIGASCNAAKLSTLIAPQWKWQETKPCQDLVSYAGVQATANDKKAPLLSLALVEDTGSSKTDKITYNPNLSITATDNRRIATLTAKLQGNNPAVDILSKLKPDGTLTLNLGDLESSSSSLLADGNYTVSLTATDVSGNQSTTSLTFTLDTTKPISTFDLLPGQIVTNNLTTDTRVASFTGTTEANAQLIIEQTPASGGTPIKVGATADDRGKYPLNGVNLALGVNNFRITATDVAGNSSSFDKQITRVAKQDDAVITWNKIALNAIQTDKTAPPAAERILAIVETAVYDAVNDIARVYKPYHVDKTASVGASQAAAAAEAAWRVLTELFPNQKATFDAALATSLAAIADSQSKTDGVAFGKDVAEAMLLWRSTDGSTAVVPYTPDPNKTPGKWQPTPPAFGAAVLPQWGKLTPFIVADPDSYTPAPPPALTSDLYATEYNEVKDLGSLNSQTRTADQTQIAKFWADGGGTYTPPGHWNQIAASVAVNNGNTLLENARLFGTLNVALADAGICCWNTKYKYDFWRPITAIQAGDKDGNDKTTVDPTWAPLLTTPAFPEYTSGHATFSGAADAVLTGFFGDNYAFGTTSIGLPGVTRTFASFHQAAIEACKSRIYGGIHFNSASVEGLNAGLKIGDFALKNFAIA